MPKHHTSMYETARRHSATGLLRVIFFWSAAAGLFAAITVLKDWAQISAFVALSFIATMQPGRNIMHPWVWFPILFMPYATFHAIGLQIAPELTGYDEHASRIIFYHTIALLAFLMGSDAFASARLVEKPDESFFNLRGSERFYAINWLIIAFTFLLTSVSLFAILTGGYSSKQEIGPSSNPLLLLGLAFIVLPLFVMAQVMWSLKTERSSAVLVAIVTVYLLLAYLISGERDWVFRMVVVYFFFLFDLKLRFRRRYLYFFVLIGVFVMPITQALKGLFIGGSHAITYGLVALFRGEFRSSGFNLHWLLRAEPAQSWGFLLNDILLAIPFAGSELMSTGRWFNHVLRPDLGIEGSSGWGFSMVGSGYLNGGALGVFLIYLAIGGITGLFYRVRMNNIYMYLIFLFYIPVLIYVQRADPANFLNNLNKTILLPMLILFISQKIAERAVSQGKVGVNR